MAITAGNRDNGCGLPNSPAGLSSVISAGGDDKRAYVFHGTVTTAAVRLWLRG
ncbi:hypothetical protein ACFV23_29980 [Streptomyces sp. NPDC059627]